MSLVRLLVPSLCDTMDLTRFLWWAWGWRAAPRPRAGVASVRHLLVGDGHPRESSPECRLSALLPLELLAASPRLPGLQVTAALCWPHSRPHRCPPAVATATEKTEEMANPLTGRITRPRMDFGMVFRAL